jgi:hypothetical protein
MIAIPEGFELVVDVKPIRRMVVGLTAGPGCGKTNFLLTAPDPIALYDMDTGTRGVIEKFVASGKKIYRSKFDYRTVDKGIDINAAVEMWDRYRKTWKDWIQRSDTKTIACDTGTEMWELARLARLGKLSNVMPHNYGPVNAEFYDLIRLSDIYHKNFIFTHKVKEQYVNDKFTGKYVRAGFKDMDFIIEVGLDLWKQDGVFYATINKCRPRPELEGEVLEGDAVCWDVLEMMVFD